MSLAISIDARPLVHEYTGIGVYLREVLSHLIPYNDCRWFLYSDQPFRLEPGWEQAVIRCCNNSSARLSTAYAQLAFGRWSAEDRTDLFWSPRHQLPLPLKPSIPTAVTLHDLVFQKYPETMTPQGRLLENLLTPKSLRRANLILTTSVAVENEISTWDPTLSGKTIAVPLASSIDRFAYQPPPNIREPYFVFCGSLEPRKNLDRLIHAFLDLKRSEPSIPHKFVIVTGGGWRDSEVRNLIANNSQHFELYSKIDESLKAQLIRHSEFLALPSLYEGFGIPIIEALKLGRPILTSNRGAMKEMAGNAALFIDPDDPGSIRNGLMALCTNKQLRDTLAENAITNARDFSWATTAKRTMEALASIAAK